ncbi:hypothetical protein BLNAU_21941 [Blattamonas nauphoetae]|uniref:Uncharacterized protein n=1 Tax=Blattamonas nauphoetae TaxID=2049346 RepID=A0ABQ9WUG3_9EUKA|nr:hypothetical protein BLNAU_21941 [Blattamonas nauphoetae]
MNIEKVDKIPQNDDGVDQESTQHFTGAELDRYIEERIEQHLKSKRSSPARSSSSSSLVSISALSTVPFEEEIETSSTEEVYVRKKPLVRKRKFKKDTPRGGPRKKPKVEGSSTEERDFPQTQSRLRSPPTVSASPPAWSPELAWLTQLIQSPSTRRTNALSMFEENEIFRREVGQWIRKSMKGWNGSFTDDVLDTRLRDTLIAGATEMRKDAGIPSYTEFQAIEREGWRKTQERALSGAVQSTLTSIAVTADVLRSLGNMPEDQEKKEQLGQAIALMIDATTRTDSSRYIDESSEALYARSSGLPEPFTPQVQRQLQGEAQLAKLAFSNQRIEQQLFRERGEEQHPRERKQLMAEARHQTATGTNVQAVHTKREAGSGPEGGRSQQ